MIDCARDKFDLEVIDEVIEDFAAHATDKFDVIVLNAVLEHVYNPDRCV